MTTIYDKNEEKGNTNTPPIQLMRPKVNRKQIQEFGNNTVNKLIAFFLLLIALFHSFLFGKKY
jgi:hypothetical protein